MITLIDILKDATKERNDIELKQIGDGHVGIWSKTTLKHHGDFRIYHDSYIKYTYWRNTPDNWYRIDITRLIIADPELYNKINEAINKSMSATT